jgi:2-oxoglutarate ferredoxin oxidoreductase subunit delta
MSDCASTTGFPKGTEGGLMTQEDPQEQTKASKRGRRLPRGRVTVFPNWCKGCNLCVEFCPMHVLEQGRDGRVIVAHPEKCTACRWCELRCPDFAIFVQEISSSEDTDDASPEEERSDTALKDHVSESQPQEEAA